MNARVNISCIIKKMSSNFLSHHPHPRSVAAISECFSSNFNFHDFKFNLIQSEYYSRQRESVCLSSTRRDDDTDDENGFTRNMENVKMFSSFQSFPKGKLFYGKISS